MRAATTEGRGNHKQINSTKNKTKIPGLAQTQQRKQMQSIETCSDDGDDGRNADSRKLLRHFEEEETAGGNV
jgi:hypothetical protein